MTTQMGEGATYRHARLSQILQDEVRAIFRDDVSDPVLAEIAITGVALSVDYRHLRVHYTCSGTRSRTQRIAVQNHLLRAKAFVRARIAESVDTKHLPDLDFIRDE